VLQTVRSRRAWIFAFLALTGLLLAIFLVRDSRDCLGITARVASGTIMEARSQREDVACYIRRHGVDADLQQRGVQGNGPLRPSPRNPRYFADGTGRIVFLAGSHTWLNLQDIGDTDPPEPFDFEAWLEFLQSQNHNFFRLWVWEQAKWSVESPGDRYGDPLPYLRVGDKTDLALDGKPKFDLTKLDQRYFDRLRERVAAAGARGIYVSVMLFNGWSVAFPKGQHALNNPWLGHPYNAKNNVNGIPSGWRPAKDGVQAHELVNGAVTALQEAYVRKVIDTVNDLDNVLYEVSNESHRGSLAWQYHMIDFIHRYEAAKPKQHPVGMTPVFPDGGNADLYASSADWISLLGALHERPAADGRKVVVADTDHLCGICGDVRWVWTSFTRGENLLFMDQYDDSYRLRAGRYRFTNRNDVALRRNLGFARRYAQRMDLARTIPRPDLASSGLALANPGTEYLVFVPEGGRVAVQLGNAKGAFSVEWLEPESGRTSAGAQIQGGSLRTLAAPFSGSAVLYLAKAVAPRPQ
jgi:hypothetical protein